MLKDVGRGLPEKDYRLVSRTVGSGWEVKQFQHIA